MSSTAPPVAVCSWSLEPTSIDDLTTKIRACGLSATQLALGPLLDDAVNWRDVGSRLADANIRIVSAMMGCVGEDYSTIARISDTGGVMPDATYPFTLRNMQRAAPLAATLGVKLLTFHAGFVPHGSADPLFFKGIVRVTEIARVFADHGIAIALETGQEPADAMLNFLSSLDLPSIGINFDPANMLLYGSGDPIAALKSLLPRVKQVHIKDAVPSNIADQWGSEVPAGTGQVNWNAFFNTLALEPNLARVIEREAGSNRVSDVITARRLIERQDAR